MTTVELRRRSTQAGPLVGLKVADFSRVLAGPLATMYLGDLGADVIKVERPGSGDDTRAWGPPFAPDGEASYYLAVNRNKRSVAIDLATDHGRDAARALATRADVVVENFKAGMMERLGLGYGTLSSISPGLIFARISGFGSGPGADLPGYDFLVQAMSGFMSITGDTDGEPLKTGVAIVDVLAGLNCAIGILAALNEREHTQLGQYLEVDLLSSALAGLVNQAASHTTAGVTPGRLGNLHPSITPYEPYRTATTPLALAVGNDKQFAALCDALEIPETATDPRWSTNPARVANRHELHRLLEEVFETRPCDEWITRLRERAIPVGPINDIGQAFDTATKLGLDPIQRISRPDGTDVATVVNPAGLQRTPPTYRLPPPQLGEHTTEILAELGLEERS